LPRGCHWKHSSKLCVCGGHAPHRSHKGFDSAKGGRHTYGLKRGAY
jgi:hypothetical protein